MVTAPGTRKAPCRTVTRQWRRIHLEETWHAYCKIELVVAHYKARLDLPESNAFRLPLCATLRVRLFVRPAAPRGPGVLLSRGAAMSRSLTPKGQKHGARRHVSMTNV